MHRSKYLLRTLQKEYSVIEARVNTPLKTLTARQIKGKSLYVIGDIHGCYHELLELEERIHADAKKRKQKPLIICVGDYCDRGPMSQQVIEHIRLGSEAGTHLGVIGNHEWFFLLLNATPRLDELADKGIDWPTYLVSCVEIYQERHPDQMPSNREIQKLLSKIRGRWVHNGGDTTMKSYKANVDDPASCDAVPLEHLKFLLTCPIAIKTPLGVITHAHLHREHLKILSAIGKNSKSKLKSKKPSLQDLATLRQAVDRCLWNRILPKEPVMTKAWHFSGHTPSEKIRKSPKNHWVQLDTGCVYGNKLTAVHMQSRKSISVKSHQPEYSK